MNAWLPLALFSYNKLCSTAQKFLQRKLLFSSKHLHNYIVISTWSIICPLWLTNGKDMGIAKKFLPCEISLWLTTSMVQDSDSDENLVEKVCWDVRQSVSDCYWCAVL